MEFQFDMPPLGVQLMMPHEFANTVDMDNLEYALIHPPPGFDRVPRLCPIQAEAERPKMCAPYMLPYPLRLIVINNQLAAYYMNELGQICLVAHLVEPTDAAPATVPLSLPSPVHGDAATESSSDSSSDTSTVRADVTSSATSSSSSTDITQPATKKAVTSTTSSAPTATAAPSATASTTTASPTATSQTSTASDNHSYSCYHCSGGPHCHCPRACPHMGCIGSGGGGVTVPSAYQHNLQPHCNCLHHIHSSNLMGCINSINIDNRCGWPSMYDRYHYNGDYGNNMSIELFAGNELCSDYGQFVDVDLGIGDNTYEHHAYNSLPGHRMAQAQTQQRAHTQPQQRVRTQSQKRGPSCTMASARTADGKNIHRNNNSKGTENCTKYRSGAGYLVEEPEE